MFTQANPDEAPAHVRRRLDPTEQIAVARRLHPAPLLLPGAIALVGFFVAVAVDTLTPARDGVLRDVVWLAWFLVLLYFGWKLASWWTDYLVVTNKRILVVGGLIAQTVNMMPLGKLTDMAYKRSAMGRLLGYGLFDFESAGQDQALRTIKYVPDVENVYLDICHLLFGS